MTRMSRVTRASRAGAGRSLLAGTAMCAVAAAMAVMGGCSAGGGPSTAMVKRPPPTFATVMHWGSLFGERRGYFDTQTSPAAVTLPGTVAEVGSSNSTQYALVTNGSLYAWGLGTRGQLGDGSWKNSFTTPVRVRFPPGVKIASIPTDVMPFDAALAVDTKGNVWGWGDNGGGELCLGNTRSYSSPVELPLSHVTALAGASAHALYDADGTVYACGRNFAGDLGDGSARTTSTPVKVAGLNGRSVTTLVASFADSGALLSNGEYFDWGYNGQGQLGDGHFHHSSHVPLRVSLPGPVTQVVQGGSYWGNGQTLVMLSNGSLWAWGAGRAFQLGDQKRAAEPVPVRVRAPAGVSYQILATGAATSYGVSATGEVYAWGASHLGQVGNGSRRTAMIAVPVAVGATSISSTANNVVISVPGGTWHRQA
jgi:alpha-tubulin suppressor-like RCC1 family protein